MLIRGSFSVRPTIFELPTTVFAMFFASRGRPLRDRACRRRPLVFVGWNGIEFTPRKMLSEQAGYPSPQRFFRVSDIAHRLKFDLVFELICDFGY